MFDTADATVPAKGAEAVTPHDTNVFTSLARALYVGAAGDVAVTTPAGDNVTFVGVPAGYILPVQVWRVLATGTTASSIVALF
jgi:hypothetical protein